VIYAHARILTSLFTNLLKVPFNFGLPAKCSALYEVWVAGSISGDKFVTGNRINAPTIIVKKSPKMVPRAGNDRVVIKKNGCAEFKYYVKFLTGSSNMVETAHASEKSPK